MALTTINRPDDQKALFGTGNDLEIYHDGTNSYIKDVGTGALVLATSKLSVNNAASNEELIVAYQNGSVELFYDNVKHFETTASGAKVNTGNLYLNRDDAKIIFGASDDFSIYHTASSGTIFHDNGPGGLLLRTDDCYIQNAAGDETMIRAAQNGAIKLYYDNVKKFETTSDGVLLSGHVKIPDDSELRLGSAASGDIRAFHSSDNSYIQNYTGDLNIQAFNTGDINLKVNESEKAVICTVNGAVELYYDNVKKLNTHSNGITLAGHINMDDNYKLLLGSSGSDLEIYHDGTNSKIHNATGTLGFRADNLHINNAADNENLATFTADGAVNLYYDNSKKFETISTGINVTGGIRLGGNNTANELDDYEEGIYTATLTCLTSGTITVDSSYDRLAYTKIGRVVYITGRIRVDAVSSPSGAQLRLNLPVASHVFNYDAGRVTGYVYVQGGSKDIQDYTSMPTAGGNTFIQIGFADTDDSTGDVCAGIDSNTLIAVNFHYVT